MGQQLLAHEECRRSAESIELDGGAVSKRCRHQRLAAKIAIGARHSPAVLLYRRNSWFRSAAESITQVEFRRPINLEFHPYELRASDIQQPPKCYKLWPVIAVLLPTSAIDPRSNCAPPKSAPSGCAGAMMASASVYGGYGRGASHRNHVDTPSLEVSCKRVNFSSTR